MQRGSQVSITIADFGFSDSGSDYLDVGVLRNEMASVRSFGAPTFFRCPICCHNFDVSNFRFYRQFAVKSIWCQNQGVFLERKLLPYGRNNLLTLYMAIFDLSGRLLGTAKPTGKWLECTSRRAISRCFTHDRPMDIVSVQTRREVPNCRISLHNKYLTRKHFTHFSVAAQRSCFAGHRAFGDHLLRK